MSIIDCSNTLVKTMHF